MQGHLRGIVGPPVRRRRAFRLLLQTVLQSGKLEETDFRRDPGSSEAHLGLNVPLRSPSGEIFGALLLSIDPRVQVRELQEWPLPARTNEVLLVRREGDSALVLTDLRGHPGSALQFRIPGSRRDDAAMIAIAGGEGSLQGLDYRGVPVFAAVLPVPHSPWYVIVKMDADEVWEPFRRGSTMLGMAASLFAFALGILLFVLWRRHQLRVSQDLAEAALARRAIAEQYDYLSRFANDVILLIDPDGAIVPRQRSRG